MTDYSWPDVKRAVEDALERPAAERAALIEQTCPDPTVRKQAMRLLRSCERALETGSPLDVSALAFAAPIIAEVDRDDGAVPAGLRDALAGHYTIERELGRGGMATVYLARDERHGRSVAVKVVRSDLPFDQSASLGAARFKREIEIAARLSHPHILAMHDSGAAAGLLYYIMPYVEGESLHDRLARGGRLPIADIVRVLRDVASALAHAHRHGIVHRDIKPGNILLNLDGDALVSDFGVAKALAAASGGDTSRSDQTTTNIVLGTPAYIAPEQVASKATIDQRADLHALGVVAYEMLSGALPFEGRAVHELLAAHLTEQPAPIGLRRPDTPPVLAELVSRLLAKNPADRPQQATEVLESLNATALLSSSSTTLELKRQRSRQRALGGAVLVVAIAALIAGVVLRDQNVDRIETIAVLPFANTSGDPENEPFSDGLTEELIAALSKVSGLKVAGRTSTFALKGKGLSTRSIADTLNVTNVLEGSVRRDSNNIKVSTQLVDVQGTVVWSETYERQFRDIFDVQEEIARAVVDALALQLSEGESTTPLVGRGTDNMQAYQLYLKGRYLYNQRQREALFTALTYFEQAIALDSMFPAAHGGMADVYKFLGIFGFAPPHEAFPRARAAVDRAIALDSRLAEAHATLAHLLFVYDWNWRAADAAFKRTFDLNPSYAEGRIYYGVFLHITGRHDEALAQLRAASEIDPLAPTDLMQGRIYVNMRQPDRAIEHLLVALQLNRNFDLAHQQLAHAYKQKGMHQEAIVSMRRAAELSGPRDSAQLAYIYAAAGDSAQARLILRKLLSSASERYLPPFHIAMGYAGLGDVDNAFRWLDTAYAERASFMDGISVSVGFESIRSDPRFVRLLDRMGLRPGNQR